MITALWFVLEVAMACHCAAWRNTPHGWHCTAPVERPRCELVTGWHEISRGTPVCSRRCGVEL